MAYRGCVADFQAIREGKIPRRVPVVACSEEFDVKWHGHYTYEEFCQDAAKIVEVYRAAIDHFEYDWAWVQIDDCFEFEPIGVGVHGESNILRATYQYLPATRDGLEELPVMDPAKDGRMPQKLAAIRALRKHYGDDCLITGSCAAPFSAVGLMWGIEESMVLMLTDPQLLQDAMDYWLGFCKRYIQAQKEAGAHAIWLGDCNAFSNLVSVEQYQQHILPITRKLVQYGEKELDVLIWVHNSETKLAHVLSHLPLGHSIESIGPAGDMNKIRPETKGKLAISGNIDPLEVLWKGTPQLVASEVRRLFETCKSGGGWVCATGEMIPRDVGEENMLAYTKLAKALAAY
jgi:uroporphyrinogen decarboxylase